MKKEVEALKKYVRAANYISASQIFLKDNFLLKNNLEEEDIKPRLLGHWGTCPGINFVYANLNNLIKKKNCEMMFVLGPGHGFPALQANLFLEGTLEKFYPEAKRNERGLGYVVKNFSWPNGFPSHSNPGTPGVILEGGELGYSLATSYGAALDNPELIVACLVGDGEAETGATATAWHLNKFIDPAKNGAVLPILHVNGYKISGPTIFGRMSNSELKSLFKGYGYDPIIVEGSNDKIYEDMINALEYSYKKIREIQKKAKTGKIERPNFPMIVLKTLKGWSGIKEFNGDKIEGNCLSHQVVVKEPRSNFEQRKILENWLKSYEFNDLFDSKKGLIQEIEKLIPKSNLKMGMNKHAHALDQKKLILPEIKKYSEETRYPGEIGSSSMRRIGDYLQAVFAANDKSKNFRLMSPDETYSNKLDAVFKETSRGFVWPIEKWDKDLKRDGRVMEMLSEHSLQGLAQGYLLTGRNCVFASYEAFVEIVSSMADQYEKFLKMSMEFPWRKIVPSLNYILTSSGWRQEHNGFSHQNPSFIGSVLDKGGCLSKVYFPADGNSALVVMKKCLESKQGINVIVAGKTVEPRWLTIEEAEKQFERGLMTWEFASDKNPDIVFAGIGDYMTKECLAAIDYLKKEFPKLRIRFVNVLELTALGLGNEKCRVPLHDFNDYFTKDKPVIFNFHGYPSAIEPILIDADNPNRFSIHGYNENGSTTTPFDMHIRNKTSRYHLLIDALQILSKRKVVDQKDAKRVIKQFEKKIEEHGEYINRNGVDPEEIDFWKWERK